MFGFNSYTPITIGGLTYLGVWDASANSPFLTSSVGGASGDYYVVSVAGTTNLNGINDWAVGDWALFNGSAWQKIDNSDIVGIQSLNGLTFNTQTFDVATSGLDFNISSSGSIHTFNLPTASATNRGALSSTDWSTFNNKYNLPSLTNGSILFSNGSTISQNNANLFWDNINNRLGIGNTVPIAPIDLGFSTGSAGDISKLALYSHPTYGKYGFGISAGQLDYVSGGSHVFYSNNPSIFELFKIGNTGTISANSLTGVGTRMVVSNSLGELSTQSIPTVVPSSLTKTDDTNVTLTLGGTPSTALLQGVSLTLGWTGTLADSRIASASTWNAKQNAITTGTTSQYLRGDLSLATFPTIPTVNPSALSKTDDTNVTLTLGGTPSTALLQGVSLTLGWTGTLADSRIASASIWNAKIGGSGTTNEISYFTASGTIASLTTATYPSLTELSYVKGLTSSAQTQINSTYVPRVQSVTSSATVTPTNLNDEVIITAQSVGLTLANPTGSSVEGQSIIIRIKDNGFAQTIAYDTQYRAIGVTLPTTTVISKTLYLGLIRNATDSTWDVIGYSIQA